MFQLKLTVAHVAGYSLVWAQSKNPTFSRFTPSELLLNWGAIRFDNASRKKTSARHCKRPLILRLRQKAFCELDASFSRVEISYREKYVRSIYCFNFSEWLWSEDR